MPERGEIEAEHAAVLVRRVCQAMAVVARDPRADGRASRAPSRAPRSPAARVGWNIRLPIRKSPWHDARLVVRRDVRGQPVDQPLHGRDLTRLATPATAASSARSGARSSCRACRSRRARPPRQSTLCSVASRRFIARTSRRARRRRRRASRVVEARGRRRAPSHRTACRSPYGRRRTGASRGTGTSVAASAPSRGTRGRPRAPRAGARLAGCLRSTSAAVSRSRRRYVGFDWPPPIRSSRIGPASPGIARWNASSRPARVRGPRDVCRAGVALSRHDFTSAARGVPAPEPIGAFLDSARAPSCALRTRRRRAAPGARSGRSIRAGVLRIAARAVDLDRRCRPPGAARRRPATFAMEISLRAKSPASSFARRAHHRAAARSRSASRPRPASICTLSRSASFMP